MVNTEAVVGGAEIDNKEDKEEKLLCLFGINISGDLFYPFLDYTPLSINDYIVEASTMQLARLDVCLEAMLT